MELYCLCCETYFEEPFYSFRRTACGHQIHEKCLSRKYLSLM